MDVESGGGGGREGRRVLRSRKIVGGRPPEIIISISVSFFLDTYENFAFSNMFKRKWPKFEETLNFGGRWAAWVPMNPSPPKQNFVATPLVRVEGPHDLSF